MLLDSADLAFRKTFVGVRGSELDTEGVLCPKLGGAVDQGGFLIPREEFGGGTVAFPNVDAFADGAREFHDAFVTEAGHATKFNEATGDQGEKNAHDCEEIASEVFAGGIGGRGVMADLAVAGPFTTRA